MRAGTWVWGHVPRHTNRLMRDSCKVFWRLRCSSGLGLALGPCPHLPRLSQTLSGTLPGTHGHTNTDPQTHHPPRGAVTHPSCLCPVSLNLLVLGHCSLSPSQPHISPQILCVSTSLIPLSPPTNLLVSPLPCISVPCGLTSTPLCMCFFATWTACLSGSVLLGLVPGVLTTLSLSTSLFSTSLSPV